jgi:hypothetical protein
VDVRNPATTVQVLTQLAIGDYRWVRTFGENGTAVYALTSDTAGCTLDGADGDDRRRSGQGVTRTPPMGRRLYQQNSVRMELRLDSFMTWATRPWRFRALAPGIAVVPAAVPM